MPIDILQSGAGWQGQNATRSTETSRFPPTIGFMGSTTPPVAAQWVASFVQRLRELGWLEGRDVAIEYRWAEGRSERFAEIAAEFVRLKVDIILTARASRVGGTSRPRVVAGAEGSSRIARCRIELYVWLQHARAWDEVCFCKDPNGPHTRKWD
jgi:hypothetical protein